MRDAQRTRDALLGHTDGVLSEIGRRSEFMMIAERNEILCSANPVIAKIIEYSKIFK